MTERNGRDSDLDPERFNPRVVPIRGFNLPPPPGWGDPNERIEPPDPDHSFDPPPQTPRRPAPTLGPEDYTIDGKLRCTYGKQGGKQGARCDNALVTGTTGCSFHNRKYHHYHAYETPAHPDDPNPKKAQETRADRVERLRAYLERAGESAVFAVWQILEDEGAKPSDRLKAAEIVLDRSVGRQLAVEKVDHEARELDVELLELADDLLPPTGTEDPKP